MPSRTASTSTRRRSSVSAPGSSYFVRSRHSSTNQRKSPSPSRDRGLFDSFLPESGRRSSSNKGIFDSIGSSTRSLFDLSSYRGSSSFYKRRPRDGFIQRVLYKAQRAFRDAFAYARKHPMKVLVPFIMALISGGALTALLKSIGITIPAGLATALGRGGRGVKTGYDAFYSSEVTEGFGEGLGGAGSGAGWLGTAVKIGSAFL